MNMHDMRCELMTVEHLGKMKAVISELNIDIARLTEFMKQPQNLAFVALYDNEVVGFLYGYSLMSITDNEPQMFVYSIDVLAEIQNKGVGSRLFQYVVDYSKENGFSECFVITDKGNKRACRIYEKAGGRNDFEDEIVYVIKYK